MAVTKKKVIKSLENLGEDLRELLKDQYPNGYDGNITRIMNAKKEPIFVFPLETEDSIYLVKVPATKNSSGGYDVDSSEKEEFDNEDEGGGTSNRDDFDKSGGDFDNEGDSSAKEASYDPDFDN